MVSNGWTVQVTCNGEPLEACNIVLPLRIQHGRSGVANQPDAPRCEFRWAVGHVPAGRPRPAILPPGVEGDVIEVRVPMERDLATWTDTFTTWMSQDYNWAGAGAYARRFLGRIVELEAVEQHGLVVEWVVTCIGDQARLGRQPVRLDRPQESDTARAEAIGQAAGLPITVIGAPGVTLAADAIDQDALAALHEVCASSGGLLWQARDGRLMYGSQHHREGPSTQQLPCSVILDGVTWRHTLDEVVNHVTVKWKEPDGDHEYTMRDDTSIGRRGQFHRDIATLCASQSDAGLLGALILARRKDPRWVMPGVMVAPTLCRPPELNSLLALEVSDGVVIPVEVNPSPTPGRVTQWTVEGWVEEWAGPPPNGWMVQLALSDRFGADTTGLRTWEEAAQETWAHWAQGSWLEQLVKSTPVGVP
jgi:hypothetical protein